APRFVNGRSRHPMLVELKNGETLNGHLANCDNWMNLILKEVVQTSPEATVSFDYQRSTSEETISNTYGFLRRLSKW
ncbi:U6 snRNA-associated Sm-like protein, partial [Aspergillus rambellii]